jgi:hypothetical protein
MRFSSILLISLAACAPSTQSSAPVPASGDVIPSTDWRRALVGDWNVEFRLDSVRTREGSTARWTAGSLRTARGRLRLTDSAGARPGILQSSLAVDFASLLGRPMSCFDPPPTATAVEHDGDVVSLRFTPNAYDCGFSASGALRGDSLVGTWDETSFAGPVVMGRFRMRRAGR